MSTNKNTIIYTLLGHVAIKDLVGKRPYLYACDPATRRAHVVQAESVFLSDRKRYLVRIWFDNGHFLDCTLDHRLLLVDGKYRAAADLSPGDRLMVLKKGIVKHGTSRRYVYEIGCTKGKMAYEHRVVARDILGEEVSANWHVHHRDWNSLNNDPSNLIMVNRSDHATAHVQNLKKIQRTITNRRKGKTLEEVYGQEKATAWRKRLSDARKKNQEMREENHRVVKVEPMGVADEVYDIVLSKFDNYVANGVFVHNCEQVEKTISGQPL